LRQILFSPERIDLKMFSVSICRVSRILGISAYCHDSAAAQEERFTRRKHDHNFPKNAVDYCLREAKIQPEDLDYVAFYDKPLLKFERLRETYLAFALLGLLLRLRKHEPIRKGFDKLRKSYWRDAEKPADAERYFRQF
jgi:predicted NodU family carbamoyl transferase